MTLRALPRIAGAALGIAALTATFACGVGAPPPDASDASTGVLSVSGFFPTSGEVGTEVALYGTRFDKEVQNNLVKFSGTEAAVTSASTTSLRAVVPDGATTGPISVTVAGRTATSSSEFAVAGASSPLPAIEGFEPASGPEGTEVVISGSGFGGAAQDIAVRFNGAAAEVIAASDSTLTAAVPAGATTGKISVTVNGKTAVSSSNFAVSGSTSPAPTIGGFSPASGPVGTTVTLSGTNFDAVASKNAVAFNGAAAQVTAASTTSLKAVVPFGATTGKISVTVNAQTATSSASFSVTGGTSPAPTIGGFSPTSGPVGTTVTLSGTNFDAVASKNAVAFNGAAAQVTAASTTSLTAVVPSGASTGKISVTVNGQTATSSKDFTVSSSSEGNCTAPPAPSELIGWAAVSGNGVSSTTGGGSAPPVTVSTLAELKAAAKGTSPAVIYVKGVLEAGTVDIGSNKTIAGLCGAEIHGHIQMSGSVNVILRNIEIVGYNCKDSGAVSENNCSGGEDAMTVVNGSHHLWFDHDDISDGSDGNLDITRASDYITISWTKFHYSTARSDLGGSDSTGSSGHRFSNLIGHDDGNQSQDTGHLRVTFHHDWWADHVVERQPRVRFGQVHLFNNLYTSSDTSYCIGVGVGANILSENNAFVGVKMPISTKFVKDSVAPSTIKSTGNLYSGTSGDPPVDLNAGRIFSPPYSYSSAMTGASAVRAEVQSGAGPR